MRRLDASTVRLTAQERKASRLFESCLDNGLGITRACQEVHHAYPALTQDFLRYLAS